MRVLVTGGAGFIGSNLVENLLKNDGIEEVRVLDNLATGSINNIEELYPDVFARLYNMELIGLRYFNVFGPKQNPKGPYAAVIPLFIESLLNQEAPVINGKGQHSRDFTYVSNVVEANNLSLFTDNKKAINQIYNIGCGQQTSLL